jgi:hypothetical protein
MSDEFKIDAVKLDEISNKFSISRESVALLNKAYNNFSLYLGGQYLAHVMRGIECYFRKQMKNARFIVICEPYKKGEFHPRQKQASALYFPPKTVIRSNNKQSSSFIINYNADLPEKELRDYIAHEIGHLFWVATIDMIRREIPINQNGDITTEPLSSIFGVFTMSEKHDFYANFNNSGINHNNWNELFDHFLRIHSGEDINEEGKPSA